MPKDASYSLLQSLLCTVQQLVAGGSSFTAPQVAGAYACVAGRFPTLPSWCWTWMLTHDAHTFQDRGITVTIPSLP